MKEKQYVPFSYCDYTILFDIQKILKYFYETL